MKNINDIYFALWSLLNIAAAFFVAVVTSGIMGLRYTEMHTLGTAMDPDPSLTRETVIRNVLMQSASVLPMLLIIAAVFWGLNYAIYLIDGPSKYKRAGFWVSCICSFQPLFAVLVMNYACLSKYPQHF